MHSDHIYADTHMNATLTRGHIENQMIAYV